MLALTLSDAKNIAIALVAVFVVASVASAWILKTIVQKVAVAAMLAMLAFGAWSQRDAVQECGDRVQTQFENARAGQAIEDTTCTFFGFDVPISDPRDDDPAG